MRKKYTLNNLSAIFVEGSMICTTNFDKVEIASSGGKDKAIVGEGMKKIDDVSMVVPGVPKVECLLGKTK